MVRSDKQSEEMHSLQDVMSAHSRLSSRKIRFHRSTASNSLHKPIYRDLGALGKRSIGTDVCAVRYVAFKCTSNIRRESLNYPAASLRAKSNSTNRTALDLHALSHTCHET